ncbi:DNA topology modulation protein FlaR [Pacificibacter sp. AS14]|uniref:DNA topology modulation protein FlaR n=1 Tax=Pacificibacter sp. AS14 TaxID=3135785 RepID=UPI00317819E8
MQRLIVTGSNGTGKSHLAARLNAAHPDIAVVSFDAIKLTRNWSQRPRPEIDAELAQVIAGEAWILEGGPSLLDQALARAEIVLWIDPPEYVRVWRLLTRPWRNFGKTRAELPDGNVDWPLQQYKFALRSFKNRSKFRRKIASSLEAARLNAASAAQVWHCRTRADLDAAVKAWAEG